MNTLISVIYGLSSILFGIAFFQRKFNRLAHCVLIVGFICQTGMLLNMFFTLGYLPFDTSSRSIYFLSWLLGFSYLLIIYRVQVKTMGVFLVPIVWMTLTWAVLMPDTPLQNQTLLENPWFVVHVGCFMMAYAVLTYSFITSIMYFCLFYELRKKQLGLFYSRMPSLSQIEGINTRTIVWGAIGLTIGILAGVIWQTDVGERGLLKDPKVYLSLGICAIYYSAFYLRRSRGWQGVRIVAMSIFGYLLITFNFVLLHLIAPASHRF